MKFNKKYNYLLSTNKTRMKTTKKAVLVMLCASFMFAMTACTRKSATGCPAWSKANHEQPTKKSV